MDKRSRFVELFHSLQDPHLVARFQRICGVRGAFSRSVSVGSRATITATSSNEEERARACDERVYRHHSDVKSESEDVSAGEADNLQTTAAGVRERFGHCDCVKSQGDVGVNPPWNVAAVTAEGEAVALSSNGRGLAGSNAACRGVRCGRGANSTSNERETEEGSGAPCPPASSTLKPLRRNSLTGDAGQEFMIDNRFLYYLFTFGTELGNELFFIVFFSFIMWNVDAFVSRRLIMVWAWVMYLGQCTKDVIGWSRPASPPVVKVEVFYNSEYSMPSTHAMSGTATPFSLLFMTYGRWEYPFSLGFSLALCWCLLVCVSRIYMGMHSVLDVIAGVLYSALSLLLFLPALDLIDGFNVTYRYSPLIIIFFHLGLCLFSFTLDTWSTSRADTAQILGTGAGVALASHVNHLLGFMPDPTPEQLPFTMPALSASLVGFALLRLFLGVLVVVATQTLMKAITIPLLCRVFGVPSTDLRKARQHMEVELPYRYIVYGIMGFNGLFVVPLLFSYMHLS